MRAYLPIILPNINISINKILTEIRSRLHDVGAADLTQKVAPREWLFFFHDSSAMESEAIEFGTVTVNVVDNDVTHRDIIRKNISAPGREVSELNYNVTQRNETKSTYCKATQYNL